MKINGVPIEDEFAEAFDMKATRLIITGHDRQWALEAANSVTGFGTSVIACGIETAIEQELAPEQTPDGRPGFAVLAFAVSGTEMEKQIPRRIGQCVLTCPTSACFAGIEGDKSLHPKRIPMGKTIRYFGDGHQISKVVWSADGKSKKRLWRVPVMDGEFVCEHDVGRVDGIGGGNFLLLGDTVEGITVACRAAIEAIGPLAGVITPFPGGAARSGSKVGSKYAALFASTNDAFCPTLRTSVDSLLREGETVGLEIVLDGMTRADLVTAIKTGVDAACRAAGGRGLLRVTAGNYGGKLGRHHFRLHEVMA